MNNKDFVELVAQNPDLPIITLVHGEVCGDDCGYWLGHCGSAAVELVGLIGERYYTDFEEFTEVYYDRYCFRCSCRCEKCICNVTQDSDRYEGGAK